MNKKLNYFTAIVFLSKYIKKYKKNFVAFYIGWLLDTIINVLLPILLSIFVDEIVYYQNISSFYHIGIFMVAVILFLCVLYFFIYSQHQYLMSMYTYEIKMDIFKRWQCGTADTISDESFGNVLTLLQSYSSECLFFIIRNIIHFTNGIIKMLVIFAILFFINWRIGLFVLIAGPLSVYVNVWLGQKSKKYGENSRKLNTSYIGWLFEMLRSLNGIKILGAKKKVEKEFIERNIGLINYKRKSEILNLTTENIIKLINLCVQLIIFAFAGLLAVNNNITIGEFLLILSYYSLLKEQIWWTSKSYVDSQRRISYIQSVHDFMNIPIEGTSKRVDKLVIKNGDIEFKNIKFAYRNSTLLFDDLSLCVWGGKKTAIVGESGCGKSTLAYMLLGFYEPTCGDILIDGSSILDKSLVSIRNNIGLISQDVLLFTASIRENILVGNIKATETEIIDACQKAGIWDFIQTLPQKLDTVIGTDDQNLSGGQKQRIAIARVYVKKPSIVIFDEATSAIDDETEESIHNAWSNILSNKTAIIITHKLSSVKSCDNVIVIKNGCVDEAGSVDYIIHHNKEFKRIFLISEKDNDAKKT